MEMISKAPGLHLTHLIGALGGFVSFRLWWIARIPSFLSLDEAMGVVAVGLVGTIMAAGAGAFVGGVQVRGEEIRTGFIAGMLAAVSGGGLMVLAATLREFGWFDFSLASQASPIFTVQVVVLAFLPALLVAQIVSYLVSEMRRRPLVEVAQATTIAVGKNAIEEAGNESSESNARRRGAGLLSVVSRLPNVLPAILIVSGLCYVSPFALAFKKPQEAADTSERVVEELTVTTPDEVVDISAPKPPAFRYVTPDGFADADAARWKVATLKRIEGVESGSPAAISPDGRMLTLCSRDSGFNSRMVVRLFELATLESRAVVAMPSGVKQLAWAPSSDRMFYVADGEVGVIEIGASGSGRRIALPRPMGDDIPSGQIQWKVPGKIFFANGNSSTVLDLEMLTVKNAALQTSSDDSVLASTGHWELGIKDGIFGYRAPAPGERFGRWTTQTYSRITVASRDVVSTVTLFDIERPRDKRFLSSPDGSILVELADGEATVRYMGLADWPVRRAYTIAMGSARDSNLESPIFTTHMKDLMVSVFICAPMINPLNGKTVGPQRDHVKARAQLMSWGGKTAEIWVTDSYRDINVGDVVADPHIWNKDAPEVVTTPLPADWFAVIGQQDSAEPTIALVRSNIGAASRQEEIKAVRDINEPESDAEPASMSLETAQRNVIIQNFLIDHHQKASAKQLDAFVEDFGTSVDYFDHGRVRQSFIRTDQAEYSAKWARLREEVDVDSIKIGTLGDQTCQVTYRMKFTQEKADGNWATGISTITLTLDMSGRPKIVRQRASVSNLKKSNP
jgi:hypothetical protein